MELVRDDEVCLEERLQVVMDRGKRYAQCLADLCLGRFIVREVVEDLSGGVVLDDRRDGLCLIVLERHEQEFVFSHDGGESLLVLKKLGLSFTGVEVMEIVCEEDD